MRISNMSARLARIASATALALFTCSASAQPVAVGKLVFLGTSLSDTGNSYFWLSKPENAGCGTPLNVPPYGALDELLTPEGPYAKGGHHVSNGATWTEGVARGLALAGNARPALFNAGAGAGNYAVFGARAVTTSCRFNLQDQVSAYLASAPRPPAKGATLVSIEIGSNDVRDAFAAVLGGADQAAIQAMLQAALTSVGEGVGALYQYGGVRDFLLVNVPDITRTPASRMLAYALSQPPYSLPADQVAQLVGAGKNLSAGYNAGLQGFAQYLMQALPGSNIKILDIHKKVEDIVANPGGYGLVNVTDACVTPNQAPYQCTNPDSYLFWDGIHPTKAVHAIIAQQALERITAP